MASASAGEAEGEAMRQRRHDQGARPAASYKLLAAAAAVAATAAQVVAAPLYGSSIFTQQRGRPSHGHWQAAGNGLFSTRALAAALPACLPGCGQETTFVPYVYSSTGTGTS